MHSSSAEEESLKLVEDFIGELTHALDSLGDWTPDTRLNNYRLWPSIYLKHAVDGFAFLRRRGLVKSSKFHVRPALEIIFEKSRAGSDLNI